MQYIQLGISKPGSWKRPEGISEGTAQQTWEE